MIGPVFDPPAILPQSSRSSHADARRPIDVEALLHWAYQVQRADVVEARTMRAGAGGTNEGRLGAVVDGGGYALRLDRDAETIHDAVLDLPSWRRRIVVDHARAGTRPDARLALRPRIEPCYETAKTSGRRRIVVRYDWAGKTALWCPLAYRDFDVEADRARYGEWWLALVELRAALDGRLVAWRVTGPVAVESPWEKAKHLDRLETAAA